MHTILTQVLQRLPRGHGQIRQGFRFLFNRSYLDTGSPRWGKLGSGDVEIFRHVMDGFSDALSSRSLP